ncbi:acyl-CoA dehydrogenase family protein [Nocardioides sp. W7]|uniref:acyl-CoA dehydrogenase family protein n=1 Tax=Nocardioides sp. W7 TaxID=2931390 RepID=UPI001FD01EB7|nr:acyl-CoA dehydrogenase family protein [Nocardioides sp. W7]
MTLTHPTPEVDQERGSAPRAEGAPSDAELRARFAPVFEEIRAGAALRDHERRLPFAEVNALREAGFTRLTVPVDFGGYGRSIPELFAWLVELAAADSNVAQLLRAHFGVVEMHRATPHRPWSAQLLTLAGSGAIVGNASHERAGAEVGRLNTRLTRGGEGWHLNGTKYYSTGSLFADWVVVVAEDEQAAVRSVLLPVATPGLELVDDWDGFGQQLTGSGTTLINDVVVSAEQIDEAGAPGPTYLTAFFELVLLAALAGVAAAVARDAADFVRNRTRVYSSGAAPQARLDPLVQQVVGRLQSTAFAARGLVAQAALVVEEASESSIAGRGTGAPELMEAAELAAVQTQIVLVPMVTAAATELFEVGGASATSTARRLDRHWRNARTISSHNPTINQERVIGDHLINGAGLVYHWATGTSATPEATTKGDQA